MLSLDGHEEGVPERHEKVMEGVSMDEIARVFLGVRTGLVIKCYGW